MKKENILNELAESITNCDVNALATNVAALLQVCNNEEEASREIGAIIFNQYTTHKAPALAQMLETVIRHLPSLAMLGFPENYFFKTAVLLGSVDLYECYIEEAIEPFLASKDEGETIECYLDLATVAEQLTDSFFPNYVQCKKGMDFNGAFGVYEKNENVCLINIEDYETMNDVVEKYNTIIGRRDIVKDLYVRAE